MICSLIITSSIWLGYEIINLLSPPSWDQLSVLASAIPFGFGISSWIYYFIQSFHSLNPFIGIFVSISYIIISSLIHISNRKPIRIRQFTTSFILLSIVLTIIYLMLLSQTFLKNGNESSATSYSDLPFHLSLITSFAYGFNSGTSTKQTPFYAGANLCYPIIADYFSSILVSCGKASLRVSLAVPTSLLLFSLTISLYDLSYQFSRRRYVPELGIIFYLLASGTGWRYAFIKKCRDNINTNFVHSFCENTYTFWIHSLIHFLLPQRSGLFSSPISIYVISLLITISKDIKNSQKTALLAGIMMGIVPMMSAHSYIAVGEYAIFICLMNFPFKQLSKWFVTIKTWCCFGFPALFISIPQIIWLTREKRSNFFTFNPIHKETDSSTFGFFKVWWSSLGAFVFLSLISVWIFNSKEQNFMYLPSVCVWIISNIIRYQPGAMDNTKVFLVAWYPLACSAVANFFILTWKLSSEKARNAQFFKNKKDSNFGSFLKKFAVLNGFVIKIAIIVATVGFCYGSSVCIYKAVAYSFPMFNIKEKNLGLWMTENTPKNAVMMCGGWGQNPVMSIGGRLVTLGYLGWVWTHGLDMNTRMKNQNKMNLEKEDENLFLPLNIKYVMSHNQDASKKLAWDEPSPYSIWMPIIDLNSLKIYRKIKKF